MATQSALQALAESKLSSLRSVQRGAGAGGEGHHNVLILLSHLKLNRFAFQQHSNPPGSSEIMSTLVLKCLDSSSSVLQGAPTEREQPEDKAAGEGEVKRE